MAGWEEQTARHARPFPGGSPAIQTRRKRSREAPAPPSVLPRSPNRQARSRQDANNVQPGHHRFIIGPAPRPWSSRAERLVARGRPAEAPGRSRTGTPRQSPRTRRRGEGWSSIDAAEQTGGGRPDVGTLGGSPAITSRPTSGKCRALLPVQRAHTVGCLLTSGWRTRPAEPDHMSGKGGMSNYAAVANRNGCRNAPRAARPPGCGH